MKAVFALYSRMEFESRPQECIRALQLLGVDDIVLVTIAPWEKCVPGVRVLLAKYDDALRYLHFYNTVIKTIKKEKPDMVFLHDNFTAPILRYLLKHRYKGKILYDSSELYIEKEKVKSFKDLVFKFVPYCEKKYLKRADVVLAANKERAEIMVDFFGLPKMPVILENMRPLQITPDIGTCEKKYGQMFDNGKFTILYGGGVKKARRTLELAETVLALPDNIQLIVTGIGNPEEIKKLEKLIEEHPEKDIRYLGRVPRDEWKYLLDKSDISVSVFAQNTFNNKYCASGRFYESVLDGIPVLATGNPPMKNACEKFGFGVASDDLKEGLMDIRRNYAQYKANAEKFASAFKPDERIARLTNQMRDRLSGKA